MGHSATCAPTAALTTAELVFIGDYDRYVHAYDVETGQNCGALAWRPQPRVSVSFAIDGASIAIPLGVKAALGVSAASWRRNSRAPTIALYVFKLNP